VNQASTVGAGIWRIDQRGSPVGPHQAAILRQLSAQRRQARASFPCVDFECSPMRPLLRLLCPPLHKPSCPIGFCIKRQF
jgi:hypothetical protein